MKSYVRRPRTVQFVHPAGLSRVVSGPNVADARQLRPRRLGAEFIDTLAHSFEPRVDLQRFLVAADRFDVSVEVRVTVAHPGPGAEVTRHAGDRPVAVFDRF